MKRSWDLPLWIQVSLAGRFPRVEYTFVLAGFLKILTLGSLAHSAPVDTIRTAAGRILFLMEFYGSSHFCVCHELVCLCRLIHDNMLCYQ